MISLDCYIENYAARQDLDFWGWTFHRVTILKVMWWRNVLIALQDFMNIWWIMTKMYISIKFAIYADITKKYANRLHSI